MGAKEWMFGYLSLFDFSIYELVHYIDIVFPHRIKEFQKLLRVETKIRELPEIKKYESAPYAIKTFLPPDPFKRKSSAAWRIPNLFGQKFLIKIYCRFNLI